MQDFQKKQLENHREIFSKVEPIVTQDGKQDYQEIIKSKKESRLRSFITKLFRGINKSSKENKISKNNNFNIEDAIEVKIKQMNSKEILGFLNTDQIKLPENNNNIKVSIEEKIKLMNSAEIIKFLNVDDLSKVNSVASKSNITSESQGKVLQKGRANSNRGRDI